MAHTHDRAAAPGPDGRRARSHPSTPSAAVLTPPTGLPAVEPTAAPHIPQQRTPVEPTPPPAATGQRLCACGHPEEMHEHYRPGTDCGSCGARACGAFRPEGAERPRNPLARLLRRRR
ncbi:hypothetical protein H7X46_20605 [Pseudonocardia sp. C8]|uniref:hypothetical protein n=1 Tax=Pseudonocardia sp. C8 TaxID=2762759 RepID=UPI00164302F0|nr:hypothetical protein [Pseudonocardia sp. C8]MBC3193466.1 hypothetical protein [Pseudonocardia sp. C8]